MLELTFVVRITVRLRQKENERSDSDELLGMRIRVYTGLSYDMHPFCVTLTAGSRVAVET